MSNFLDSATDAVSDLYCSALSGVDNYFSFWRSLGIPIDEVSPALRSYVCDAPGPDLPPPPFMGGQCPGVPYDITFRITEDGSVVSGPTTFTAPGPIGQFSRPNDPPDGRTQQGYTFQGGETIIINSADRELETVSVVRDDGLPDECGNPLPEIPEFEPIEQSISFTYIDASDNSVNVTGNLTIFAPIFAPVGIFAPIIRVPIRLSGPNFDFSGNINLPDLNIDIYPSRARPSTGEPDPVPDVDPDSPDNPATPDDGSTRELVGLLVRSQISSETRTTEIFQPTGPNLYVPRIANAYFRVRLGDRLSWLGPFDVKTTNTFVPVPPDVVAVSARVDAEQGWTSTGTQVFRSSEPDNS